MSLDRLLRPRSIAILGASERPSVGRTLIEALDAIGFRGEVYPVNPRYESVLGRRCYPAVADLPRDVHLQHVATRTFSNGLVQSEYLVSE